MVEEGRDGRLTAGASITISYSRLTRFVVARDPLTPARMMRQTMSTARSDSFVFHVDDGETYFGGSAGFGGACILAIVVESVSTNGACDAMRCGRRNHAEMWRAFFEINESLQ